MASQVEDFGLQAILEKMNSLNTPLFSGPFWNISKKKLKLLMIFQSSPQQKIRRGPGLGRVEFYNDTIGGPGVGISPPWFRIPRLASPPLPGRCTNGEKSKNEPQASYRPKNLTI